MTATAQTNTTLQDIAQVIASHDAFVLCGHISPDGDCLGSQLCLAHALKAMGKSVTVTLPFDEPVDPSLSFLPGSNWFVPAEQVVDPFDVFIGVDVPSRDRLGTHAAALLDDAACSITIDHHAMDTTMCQYVYVDPDVASTTMLIWEIVKQLTERPPVESALCAYTGLVSDTGCFQYQNANRAAFDAAGDLVSAGADPALVARETMQNRSLPSLQLEARLIERMEFFADGQCVLSWVTLKDMAECGAQKSDTEVLINIARQIRGVRVACVLREQENLVKGSLRAKDDTDVAAIARSFNGGGHKAAAGFSLKESLDDACESMRTILSSLFA